MKLIIIDQVKRFQPASTKSLTGRHLFLFRVHKTNRTRTNYHPNNKLVWSTPRTTRPLGDATVNCFFYRNFPSGFLFGILTIFPSVKLNFFLVRKIKRKQYYILLGQVELSTKVSPLIELDQMIIHKVLRLGLTLLVRLVKL